MRMVGVIDYDIYYLNDDYHLVVKKGSTVDLKQVERLVNNGHLNFYVLKREFEALQLLVIELGRTAEYCASKGDIKGASLSLDELLSRTALSLYTYLTINIQEMMETVMVLERVLLIFTADKGHCKKLLQLFHQHTPFLVQSLQVAILSVLLAREFGIKKRSNLELVAWGGLLCDISLGQFEFDCSNLLVLSAAENESYLTHPQVGSTFLQSISHIPSAVSLLTLNHHERVDGSGFPRGITDIPPLAKIILATTHYFSLVSNRASAASYTKAMQQMKSTPKSFNPVVLKYLETLVLTS